MAQSCMQVHATAYECGHSHHALHRCTVMSSAQNIQEKGSTVGPIPSNYFQRSHMIISDNTLVARVTARTSTFCVAVTSCSPIVGLPSLRLASKYKKCACPLSMRALTKCLISPCRRRRPALRQTCLRYRQGGQQ
jgi:hypothetical protein